MNFYDTTKPYIANVKELIRQTWRSRFVRVVGEYNGFAVVRTNHDLPEVDHTDGIGTKGIHHWRNRSFADAVTDALAMNLNDLATMRATPYKLQNHLIVPTDDHDAIIAIIASLCDQSYRNGIMVTGGETSVHNNISGMELSLTVSGVIEGDILHNHLDEGDWLLGLPSNGLHSNGLTLATKVLPDNWVEVLTKPTKIYYEMVMDIADKYNVSALIHIAGGAWSRLKPLCQDVDAVIGFSMNGMPVVFSTIYESIKNDEEMYRTFNCGVGFVIAAPPDQAKGILADDSSIMHIGYVRQGTGKVIIKSGFSDKEIVL